LSANITRIMVAWLTSSKVGKSWSADFVTQLDHAAYLGRELARAGGGAFRWHHVRAGCRPRPGRSGGAAQNEKVRLPMQLDRDGFRFGNETPSKSKQLMNMTIKSKWLGALLAVAITLTAGGVRAQDQQRQQLTPESDVSVNDLAGKPGEHLGQVLLIGVVAAVSQGQGFVLVDEREYANCGLTCFAEPGTKKIPVRWSGDAPRLEQTVRVGDK